MHAVPQVPSPPAAPPQGTDPHLWKRPPAVQGWQRRCRGTKGGCLLSSALRPVPQNRVGRHRPHLDLPRTGHARSRCATPSWQRGLGWHWCPVQLQHPATEKWPQHPGTEMCLLPHAQLLQTPKASADSSAFLNSHKHSD